MLRQYIIYGVMCVLAGLMAAGVPPFPALKQYLATQFSELRKERQLALPGALPDGTPASFSRSVTGWVDIVDIKADQVVMQGWAVDATAIFPAGRVIIFADGIKVAETVTAERRQDVANRYGKDSALMSGFKISFSSSLLPTGRQSTVVVVAEGASGQFGELRYNPQFPFRQASR